MRNILVVAAILGVFTACRSHSESVVSAVESSHEATSYECAAVRIDTSALVFNADIDSPEFVLVQADSARVVMRAKRMQLSSQRKNGVVERDEVHADSAKVFDAETSVSEAQTRDVATVPQWLVWICCAALCLSIFNFLKSKFVWK